MQSWHCFGLLNHGYSYLGNRFKLSVDSILKPAVAFDSFIQREK